MTATDWEKIEKKLSYPFGGVKLRIDGHDIDVMVEKEGPKSLKYVLAVYVDGYIKGEWITNDCEIRRKFYYKRTKSLLTKYFRKSSVFKRMKKKEQKEWIEKHRYEYYSPYFSSFKTLKDHFTKNNDSIELVDNI